MNGPTAYTSKAATYAKHRWDYSSDAISVILAQTAISSESSTLADIGSGTGILSQHFADKVRSLHAIEPNTEMRQMAEEALTSFAAFQSINAAAEATTLPDRSIDIITVAQAIHWFDPEPTRSEFLRILKPGGWLAILRNYPTDAELGQALNESVYTEENGATPPETIHFPTPKPTSFYYGGNHFQTFTFPLTHHHTWETFLGATLSAAFTPKEDHPKYLQFERALRAIFDRFSANNSLETHAATELHIGRVA